MRPVERGTWPKDKRGIDKVYAKYQDAWPDLSERLGRYCSYCERFIAANLAVEHTLAKSVAPELENDWSNFLLACSNCNSTKASKSVRREDCYWPDRDNTARAFLYQEGGIVEPHPRLTAAEHQIAKDTMALTGLDRHPYPPYPPPEARDLRWQDRREAWEIAVRARDALLEHDSPSQREVFVRMAKAQGFWSIWMAVFAQDRTMQACLLRAFPGTASCCFDSSLTPIARPFGLL